MTYCHNSKAAADYADQRADDEAFDMAVEQIMDRHGVDRAEAEKRLKAEIEDRRLDWGD